MGYGSCALELLKQYYKGEVPSLSEVSSGASTELLSSSAHIVSYLSLYRIVVQMFNF